MRTFLAAAVLAMFCATSLAAGPLDLPDLDRAINYRPKQPLVVTTSDGVEIATYGTERRRFVPIERMPKRLKDAVIAVEDTRFFEHSGIDPRGMARAAVALVTGGMRQGASTITQQVARTFFLEQKFSPERKTQEIMIALELEKRLSKEKILELYMNEIYLGQRSYGFAAAAQTYFGKTLDQLSLAECAMLAGLPQNPHYANPISDLARATKRQHIVIERMRVVGVLDDAQAAAARAEKLVIAPPDKQRVHAGHAAEMARLAALERFGPDAYTRGLKVTTSLVAADQRAAWTALRRGVLAHDRRGAWRGPEGTVALPVADGAAADAAIARALKDRRDDEMLRLGVVLAASPKEVRVQLADGQKLALPGESLRWVAPALSPKAPTTLRLARGALVRVVQDGKAWQFAQWPQAEGALVAMDPATGRVRALVGSFDFGRTPFNHVTQGWRQPGSAIKPLLYSAALETGVMPDTVIDDAPFTAPNGWSPQNSDGQFAGPLTLRDALAQSRNLVSLRVLQHTGIGTARDWLQRYGLDPGKQPDNLTLALGSGSVTPLGMAQAYATLANGGWNVNPVVIERVTDASGKLLFEAPKPPAFSEDTRDVPARNVWLTTQLLGEVTRRGTAAKAQAQLRRSDVYGKTGTTNDAVDAWFCGFQPSLVAVAWMGYSEPRSLGERETGGGLALPIWVDYMATALKGVPVAPSTPPPGLMRNGDDWLYDEAAVQGHVLRINADGSELRSAPFAPPEPVAGPALLPSVAPGEPSMR